MRHGYGACMLPVPDAHGVSPLSVFCLSCVRTVPVLYGQDDGTMAKDRTCCVRVFQSDGRDGQKEISKFNSVSSALL